MTTLNELAVALGNRLPGYDVRAIDGGGIAVYPPGWVVESLPNGQGGRFVWGVMVSVTDDQHTVDGVPYAGRLVSQTAMIECDENGQPFLGVVGGSGSNGRVVLSHRKYPHISARWNVRPDGEFARGVMDRDVTAIAEDVIARTAGWPGV